MKRMLLIIILSLITPYLFCQEPIFRISTSYQNLLSNSQGTGMLDRIIKEAFQRIEIKAEIVYTSTEKSLIDVNAGLLDGEINRIEGMELSYPNLIRIPEPNMVMNFVAFSTKSIPIQGWESIRNLYLGIVKGWKILEDKTEGFPRVVYVPSEVELFTMLHKGRIDLALYADLTGYAVLEDLGFKEIFALTPPLEMRNMYLYVHKKHRDKVELIADALRGMKQDGTYDALVKEYLPESRRDSQ